MYKRKWFPLMSWGKRGDMSQEDKEQVKRAWSRFASWGKRYSAPRSWVSLGAWGKRRWTGMATWGKRSVNNDRDDVFAADTAQTLLPLFDLNGDDALDIGELQTYVRALFDLSKPEPEPKDDNSGHE
ncbi:hypothetical protein DPMN_006215 [Dreissena polymorpha]|uniref:EF-hand domain-containing protein n=2 Tax=Dreissena polymorpha TaxID=45954 RepID=A0A9D4MUV5_DREPO|nr:hypothetical protein DPMN_006215 [Dreissena polymorpha]